MQIRGVLFVSCVVLGSVGARGQSVVRSLAGASGEKLGSAIANAGDTNADGWDDYLVGTPEAGNGDGGVVCVSGKYLATGAAPSTLYSWPSFWANSQFGSTIVALGDVTGDGKTDFVVGAPGYDHPVASECGSVHFFSGAGYVTGYSHLGPQAGSHLGWSLAAAGDRDSDGVGDVIAGAPGSTVPYAYLVSGKYLAIGPSAGPSVIVTFPRPFGFSNDCQWGYAVCANVDFDGDGVEDVAISAPYAELSSGVDQGFLRVYSGAGFTQIADYWGQDNNALGRSLASGADFDGDLLPELVIGAFKADGGSNVGKVVVLSVAHVAQSTPPFEIFSWNGPSQLAGASGFGASLAIAPDLNGDGRADVLVGLPLRNATLTSVTGAVYVYSSATGARIAAVSGAQNQRLGNALLACNDDLDADGFPDFLVGAMESDSPTTDCGALVAMRLFPAAPTKYCTGKVNSLGCTPSINGLGNASASSPAAFLVKAVNVINNKNGLLFYGYSPLSVPFQGGLLCVHAPTLRTTIQNSAGSAGGNDCTGTLSLDFNARIQSGVDPMLDPGQEVFCQYWSRDPASASTTSLSDGLRFLVNP